MYLTRDKSSTAQQGGIWISHFLNKEEVGRRVSDQLTYSLLRLSKGLLRWTKTNESP